MDLPSLVALRHDLHAHPELAFEEHRSSDLVAEFLRSLGLEVHRGLAGTGVVGVLRNGDSERCIGLRADLDALPLHEQNLFPHRSRHAGRMHACGHDGHTAMLLGAARELAANSDFDGSVVFIFQPAEETDGGARVMIAQGGVRIDGEALDPATLDLPVDELDGRVLQVGKRDRKSVV